METLEITTKQHFRKYFTKYSELFKGAQGTKELAKVFWDGLLDWELQEYAALGIGLATLETWALEEKASMCPYYFVCNDAYPGYKVAKKDWFNLFSACYDEYGNIIDEGEQNIWDDPRYTYFNGNNWQTLFLSDLDVNTPTPSEIVEMWEAVDNKAYVSHGKGTKYGDYDIVGSNWASSWEVCRIDTK